MRYSDVLTVTTARAQLPRLIAATKQGESPVIGSHRKPEAVLMPASTLDVLPHLLTGFARAEAHDLIHDEDTAAGEPVHPGDPVGKVTAWLWLTGQRRRLVGMFNTLLSEMRRQVDTPHPVPTDDDLLDGLQLALPPDFPDEQVTPLLEYLRAELPTGGR